MDATPGRHTQMSAWTLEGEFSPPGLVTEKYERYQVEGKGEVYRTIAAHHHVCSAAGMCLFAWAVLQPEALTDSLTCTTGKEYSLDDVQRMGDRIAALRIAFNIREGVRNVDLDMPGRMVGSPPLKAGPLQGVTVDLDTQVRDYLEAMGWDAETGVPNKETLEGLGLDFVAADLHPAGA
jgi:aldehyde:ferredoxin oxidoreductase